MLAHVSHALLGRDAERRGCGQLILSGRSRTMEPMPESGFEPVPEAIADRYGVVIPPR
jgi:hypothetical protein